MSRSSQHANVSKSVSNDNSRRFAYAERGRCIVVFVTFLLHATHAFPPRIYTLDRLASASANPNQLYTLHNSRSDKETRLLLVCEGPKSTHATPRVSRATQ